MTEKRPLFLEGHRICDAEDNTVRELTPEQREVMLRIARQRAYLQRQRTDEGHLHLLAVMDAVHEAVQHIDPATRAAAKESVAQRMAEYRARAAAVVDANREAHEAELAELIPDRLSIAGRLRTAAPPIARRSGPIRGSPD